MLEAVHFQPLHITWKTSAQRRCSLNPSYSPSGDSFVEVATETYIHNLDSLVADFGEILSIFLGVSFMTIWHVFISLLPKCYRFYGNCKRQIASMSADKNVETKLP